MAKLIFSPPLKPYITEEIPVQKEACPKCNSSRIYTESSVLRYGVYAFLAEERCCNDCGLEWRSAYYEDESDV